MCNMCTLNAMNLKQHCKIQINSYLSFLPYLKKYLLNLIITLYVTENKT